MIGRGPVVVRRRPIRWLQGVEGEVCLGHYRTLIGNDGPSSRHGGTPFPRWGEGVTIVCNPLPHPSPYGRGSRPCLWLGGAFSQRLEIEHDVVRRRAILLVDVDRQECAGCRTAIGGHGERLVQADRQRG